MIPTSIDGTDITGATIDGTDVQEITVDGDVVFSAVPSNLPVAYSNLVAWYTFDSAEYGGSNADDVTAIIGGSGDDTPYDGSVSGATYQSSGGVTDISAGANSGAFDFDGSDNIDISAFKLQTPVTIMGWCNLDTASGSSYFIGDHNSTGSDWFIGNSKNFSDWRLFDDSSGGSISGVTVTTNVWVHLAVFIGDNESKIYVDGNLENTSTHNAGSRTIGATGTWVIGDMGISRAGSWDGTIDDVRIYDAEVIGSDINEIYLNTEP